MARLLGVKNGAGHANERGGLPEGKWGHAYGFLFGEGHDQRECKVTGKVMPTYKAFVYAFGRFYEGDPMTIPEFRKLDLNTLPLP
jgi:hypothetical protein